MNETPADEVRFREILVPVDGSERAEAALVPALALARAVDAPLVFFRWEKDPSDAGDAETELDGLVWRYGAEVTTAKVLVTSADGGVARALVDTAASRDALICMASHGRTRVGKAILGSVAAEVIALSAAAVLVVGPEFDTNRALVGQRLGICLDGSAFAEKILPLAMSWASAFGLEPWLLESASPSEMADLSGAPPSDVLETGYVSRVARQLPTRVEFDVLHGRHPAEALVAYANDHPIGVLAMSTHGRTGWTRLAEGSVALQVLHRAVCPVVLMRPPEAAGDATG